VGGDGNQQGRCFHGRKKTGVRHAESNKKTSVKDKKRPEFRSSSKKKKRNWGDQWAGKKGTGPPSIWAVASGLEANEELLLIQWQFAAK